MALRELTFSPEILAQYTEIEESIKHWSSEHTKSVLQSKRLLDAVGAMYDARMQLTQSFMKEQGLNLANVHQAKVDVNTGVVSIQYDESTANPTFDPNEDINPTAKPVLASRC